MSMRGIDVPTMEYFDGSLGVAAPLRATVNGTTIPSGVVRALRSMLNCLSPIRSANDTFALPSAVAITPLLTDRLLGGALKRLAARSRRALRASAAAWRRLP